jgi:uncharacterized protein (DUF433 family)
LSEGCFSPQLSEALTVYERISIDPHTCHGQACIKGTRIPVHQIVRMLANGDTVEGLLEDYPTLVREDILAALDYAAALAEEEVTPLESTGRSA